ncbi:MAG: hypothetical protein ACYC6G_06240 [Desulfobaccales bacterium]
MPEIEPYLFKGEDDLPDETPLYNYMKIEEFLYLIEFKRLIFSRITSWPDSYEGILFEFLKKIQSDPLLKDNNKDDFYGSCWSLQTENICLFRDDREYQAALKEIRESGSASMWETYCKNGGVRIKTTLGKLNELFLKKISDSKLIKRGEVIYEPEGSFTLESPDLTSTFFAKRISFRHESEYRFILIPNESNKEKLIYVEIDDLFNLIDEIMVAPTIKANKWISRTLYNIAVDIFISPERGANVKDGKQFCRISQLYGSISEELGHFGME